MARTVQPGKSERPKHLAMKILPEKVESLSAGKINIDSISNPWCSANGIKNIENWKGVK